MMRVLLVLTFFLLLSGCELMSYGGWRILLLVLVPAALIGSGLWLLRHRGAPRQAGRGPRYPDFDDREP